MTNERRLTALSLKIGPLGEYDRLITVLSDQEGLLRLAVPGARRPGSKFSAATTLTLLELHIREKSGMPRVSQLKVLQSFNKLSQYLETLAAAQVIAELCLLLVATNDPIPGVLNAVLIHLQRLEDKKEHSPVTTLARTAQSLVHLLALGGYGLPLQTCCRTGILLEPPIGQWDWRCSLFPEEGFAIGSLPNAGIQLNSSELALLQRLTRPELPRKKNGNLLGPKEVWLKLLKVLDLWVMNHLQKKISSLSMLLEI